ncbi:MULTISPECIES: ester cyclase [unclassified Streptomyces]|uniref:ester cyclase n=1 Tax=unclassified Streptomyces TaxID=2593676 RepID=UPI00109ECFC7|nr:ester cyclase [Streptomyces sp. A1136]THA54599.1 hypothetical protein E6R62_15575 [Streptomyces sp. A1136]
MTQVQEELENVLRRYIDELLNGHDDTLVEEFIHPEFRHFTDESALALENDGTDLEGIKAGLIEVREKLAPHYSAEVVRWEGDIAHLAWKTTVTHQGYIFDREPTGKTFTLTYTGKTRFKDGKIYQAQNYWDPQQALSVIDGD